MQSFQDGKGSAMRQNLDSNLTDKKALHFNRSGEPFFMRAELTWEIVENTRIIETRIISAVKKRHRQIMNEAANAAREAAPVDTGALKAIIYVVGPWGSGYDKSVSDATGKPGTRIVERDQISPALIIDQQGQRGVWLAAIDVPLTYALFVHEGYYSILAQSIVPKNPFLSTSFYSALGSDLSNFFSRCSTDFTVILS